MITRTINWLSLSDSQKTKVLRQAKTYLKQQVSEAKFCSALADIYKIQA
jgi:predicted Fe-S protein YdhL (DUF1289 family)